MKNLEGKIIVVSGAAQGMGAQIVRTLAERGAKVVATDIQFAKVKEVVEEVNNTHSDSAIAVEHDVSNAVDWKKVAEKAKETFGNVTGLVNNAGILAMQNIEEVTQEEFSNAMNINTWSQFAGIQALLPQLKEVDQGSIVNFSSLASKNNAGGFTPYTASKGAVEAITKAAAIELAPYKIRVNSIHPGGIATKMVTDTYPTEEEQKQVTEALPLRRFGEPEEVANLVAFLVSDDSSYITATEQIIDGGLLAT